MSDLNETVRKLIDSASDAPTPTEKSTEDQLVALAEKLEAQGVAFPMGDAQGERLLALARGVRKALEKVNPRPKPKPQATLASLDAALGPAMPQLRAAMDVFPFIYKLIRGLDTWRREAGEARRAGDAARLEKLVDQGEALLKLADLLRPAFPVIPEICSLVRIAVCTAAVTGSYAALARNLLDLVSDIEFRATLLAVEQEADRAKS